MASKVIAHGKAEVELAQSHRRIQEVLTQIVTALASAVEQRGPYTAGHQRRVADLACAIARELGLPEDRIQGLRLAALVHDVGKLAVPAEILSKPGRLSALEFELVKGHPSGAGSSFGTWISLGRWRTWWRRWPPIARTGEPWIETGKGRLYDPRVVDGCLRLFRDHGFSWSASSPGLPCPTNQGCSYGKPRVHLTHPRWGG
ncbi:MAG: HD domain-containing protein [Candidatus Acetothermia bacterium]|nr:HD domain-containing protein [Candidatus Acetothermia bacterium]